jgi:HAE1 family hydrophobic/amphiphilic exporter-1
MATMVLFQDIQPFARTKRRSRGKFGENADGVFEYVIKYKGRLSEMRISLSNLLETEIS